MSSNRMKSRSFAPELKAQICIELVRGDYSLSQSSAKYGVREQMLSRWKQEFLLRSPLVFGAQLGEQESRLRALEDQLEEQRIEISILKRALSLLELARGSGL